VDSESETDSINEVQKLIYCILSEFSLVSTQVKN